MSWLRKCRFCEKTMRPHLLDGHVAHEHAAEYQRYVDELALGNLDQDEEDEAAEERRDRWR